MSQAVRGGAFVFIMASLLIMGAFSLFAPQRVHALGAEANAMCNPWYAQCGCNQVPCKNGCCPGKNTNMCPPGICKDVTNGLTTIGICVAANKCEGVSGQGIGGEGTQMISSLLGQAMQQLMGALQGGGGAGSGAGGSGFVPTGGSNLAGCTSYYYVSAPSSDPCAIYSPSSVLEDASSSPSGIADSLLNALGPSNPSNVSGGILDSIKDVTARPASSTGTSAGTQSASPPAGDPPGKQGLSGDLRVQNAGATIFANLREGLSEIAGFFGGSTGGASQALSAAGRLCATRPWESGIAGRSIAPSFFDGICRLSGYQVGVVAPVQSGKMAPSNVSPTQNADVPRVNLTGTVGNVPPEVDIWAEPASVRLGTRTYIFWRAQGVASCEATGPNFSQNSFSGGASTVPISGPTTFSIECLTGASTTIRDSVTVQIAI